MIRITKVDEKNIVVDVNGVSRVRAACYKAESTKDGKIVILERERGMGNITVEPVAVSEVTINGESFDNVTDVVTKLNAFIGNFKGAAGPAGTTPEEVASMIDSHAADPNTHEAIQEKIDANTSAINALKGVGGYLTATDFGAAVPTQQQLTDYALSQISGITDPADIWNGTRVKNLFDNSLWVLNNTPETDPAVFEWAFDGIDTVAIATETAAGIVTSSAEDDGVAVDSTTGKMSVRTRFVEPLMRLNIASGERLSVIFGKISKMFSDLKSVAFSGSYEDLINRPTSLPANGGNADSAGALIPRPATGDIHTWLSGADAGLYYMCINERANAPDPSNWYYYIGKKSNQGDGWVSISAYQMTGNLIARQFEKTCNNSNWSDWREVTYADDTIIRNVNDNINANAIILEGQPSQCGFGRSTNNWPVNGSYISFGGFSSDRHKTQIIGSFENDTLFFRTRDDDGSGINHTWKQVVTTDDIPIKAESTTEQLTGETWIDFNGNKKPVYQKTFVGIIYPNLNSLNLDLPQGTMSWKIERSAFLDAAGAIFFVGQPVIGNGETPSAYLGLSQTRSSVNILLNTLLNPYYYTITIKYIYI